jgi:hypothetical protein
MWTKRITLIAVILALVAILFSQEKAVTTLPNLGTSGNDYLQSCEALTHAEDLSVQDVQCRTYTQGVVEGLTAYQTQSGGKLFIVTPNGNVSQVEKIIVKYMNDHPKDLDLATSRLILWALMDAYPVPKK